MGWLYTNRPKGFSDRDWFTKQSGALTWSTPGYEDYRVVDCATVNRTVFYVVLEMNAERNKRLVPDENGKVRCCLVFLIRWVPKDYYNFGYKDMDEFMGPCEATCPEKILKQLSPFDPDALAASEAKYEAQLAAIKAGTSTWAAGDGLLSARDWRKACQNRIDLRKALKKPGTKVRSPNPIQFQDGTTDTDLTVGAPQGKHQVFIRPNGKWTRLRQSTIDSLQLI